MECILVTGGAGFIGSNFIPFFLDTNPDYHLINLDKLTYAGNLENLKEIKSNKRYSFVKGDICDKDLLLNLFKEYNFKKVVHFAAESHVDNSISGPSTFIKTNIEGSFCLLDVARALWQKEPSVFNEGYEDARFLHVSTDEVYGALGETGLFTEKTPYAPSSPYSASKASSDLLVRSYFHTYDFPCVITNCSNNYGPKQHAEKLIPNIIRKALSGEKIPIYGNGKHVRDWLYVLDHCKGVSLALFNGKLGETYNIGGRNEWCNLDIATFICEILDTLRPLESGKYKDLISFVKDRPGHDLRYAIDASKIETELGWQAKEKFETGIQKTILWYLKNDFI